RLRMPRFRRRHPPGPEGDGVVNVGGTIVRIPYGGAVVGLFDASTIDFSIIGELVAQSKADTGWTDFTAFYPSVRLGSSGVPEINVYLSSDYYSASYSYTIRGDLIGREGTGLD
ncbi:hypothetical protein, partial [Pseudolysinimonas sp.]|uniref:hypothetical protein n=1 Tax=Pseudolysinimonas sp. TaxID=2680009 RepID=UPI00286BC9A8